MQPSQVVRIAFRGGGVVLPYRGPYDREVLFDYVAQCARRYGRIRVQHGRRDWNVRLAGTREPSCASCGHRLDPLVYTEGIHTFCHHCARRSL